jgi:hypothetical protein
MEDVKEHSEDRQEEIPLQDRLIRRKIIKAQDLFAQWGEALRQDPHIISLLETLALKIAASNQVMDDLGLSDICRRCDEEEGGSCCGAGIENKYTPSLLLINLLLGKSLSEKRLGPSDCFFLSEKGCDLTFRQVLCVNYLCRKIQETLPHDRLTRLLQITGEEMDAGFTLDEAVKKFIGG